MLGCKNKWVVRGPAAGFIRETLAECGPQSDKGSDTLSCGVLRDRLTISEMHRSEKTAEWQFINLKYRTHMTGTFSPPVHRTWESRYGVIRNDVDYILWKYGGRNGDTWHPQDAYFLFLGSGHLKADGFLEGRNQGWGFGVNAETCLAVLPGSLFLTLYPLPRLSHPHTYITEMRRMTHNL